MLAWLPLALWFVGEYCKMVPSDSPLALFPVLFIFVWTFGAGFTYLRVTGKKFDECEEIIGPWTCDCGRTYSPTSWCHWCRKLGPV